MKHGKCDICKKPKAFLRVNGRFRHYRCWQAYLEAEEYFFFENNDLEGLQKYVRKRYASGTVLLKIRVRSFETNEK